jgi:hypothetical protein
VVEPVETPDGSDIGEERVRVFNRVRDKAQEAGGGAAVADAVVEGQRQLGHFADGQLAVHHPRLVDDPSDAEDGHLRMVDDCRGAVHAEHTVVVEREGAAAQLSGRFFGGLASAGSASALEAES